MRAQVLYGIGNLKYTEIDKPVPKKGEALIKVNCCGICGSDVPRIYKTGAHNMPLIPGHEFMGIVEECPDEPILVGKRVGVFPLIPCGRCEQCQKGYYEMCSDYNYLGSRCDGGFAEYVTAPIWNLVPVPDNVSDEEAAMLEPMCVAVHAAFRAGINLKEAENTDDGSSIVICGLGTIGLLLAMFLKFTAYKNIFFIGNKDIQKEKLLEMGYGPEVICDVRYKDPIAFVMEKTGGRGADYYFECIGRSESYQQAVKCTAPLGTVMLVGNPASDMELSKEVYWKILRNQMTLLGTWNSSYKGRGITDFSGEHNGAGKEMGGFSDDPGDDWQFAIQMLTRRPIVTVKDSDGRQKKIEFRPESIITNRFSLEEMEEGLNIMHKKSHEYIKIMIEI